MIPIIQKIKEEYSNAKFSHILGLNDTDLQTGNLL